VDPQLGEALTRWTVRFAVACYVGRVLLDVGGAGRAGRSISIRRRARWLWTIGCGFYAIHVLAAFSYFHAWRHEAAYRHTADATAAVVGLQWGGGLYLNYLFTAFWVADTTFWWLCGPSFPYRSRAYFWTVHAVFAFMVVNATVVFGPAYWKWAAVAAALAIFAAHWLGRRREDAHLQNHG
jgi:hypothetical protein